MDLGYVALVLGAYPAEDFVLWEKGKGNTSPNSARIPPEGRTDGAGDASFHSG